MSLEEELFEMKNKQIEYRKDVESYFLTWVHQIKTPITASQLLLERNEPNVVNQVRQEIVQIDNYTRLALSYLKLLNEASDMTITEVTIDDLIKPLIMKYRIHFIEQHTKIHYQSIDNSVLTDAQWTSILIEQILNNALKYARGKIYGLTLIQLLNNYVLKITVLVLAKQTCRKSLTKDILVTMVALMNPQVVLDCLSLNILRNI